MIEEAAIASIIGLVILFFGGIGRALEMTRTKAGDYAFLSVIGLGCGMLACAITILLIGS